MTILGKKYGPNEASLSPNELIAIVIPLVGAKAPLELIADSVIQVRIGELDVSKWPNCAPGANDRRLAREFLLFLENFEICRTDDGTSYQQRFVLDELLQDIVEVEADDSFLEDRTKIGNELEASKKSIFPVMIERRRVATKVLARPGQAKFRQDVLDAANVECLLTGERTPDVLEAAHIIPVGHGGSDEVGNGFCLRMDIHRLFDAGKLRIKADGYVILGDQIKSAISYSGLPAKIVFPAPVILENIVWRSKYL